MPRQPRERTKHTLESFEFEVARWSFSYGLHLNPSARPTDLLGKGWEHYFVELEGPLCSKTTRRISTIRLSVTGRGKDPEKWPEGATRFGAAEVPRLGVLKVSATIPESSFPVFVTALAAGKITAVSFSIDFGDSWRGLRDLSASSEPYSPEDSE